MTTYEKRAAEMLPSDLSEAVTARSGLCTGGVDEIRLRLGRPLSLTVNGENMLCGTVVTEEHILHTLRALSGNSLYSHGDTIREGYIDAGDGIRAGIAGQAVTEHGRVSAVRDITSIAIRIPRRVKGAADPVYRRLKEKGFTSGVLIYARPGVGKTTVLRELSILLSTGAYARRVAVVDTRCELAMGGAEEAGMCDILRGYPRNVGIETAVRTLSPQYIICDEILTDGDADAIIAAQGSGVHLCASIHAESYESLSRQPIGSKLIAAGVFDLFAGLIPSKESGVRYGMEITG